MNRSTDRILTTHTGSLPRAGDLTAMLEAEITQRVQTGLTDEEGPWKLIAWLEQVQPPFMSGERLFPSFGLSLLLKELSRSDDFSQSVLDLIRRERLNLF